MFIRTPLFGFLVGALFGLGLIVSGMINPAKVLSFLNVAAIPQGTWDPSLALVMGGALVFSAAAVFLSKKWRKPFLAEVFNGPSRTAVDFRLIGGAGLFGLGWGLVGLCPGPAIASLALLNGSALLFVGAMVAGMVLAQAFLKH